MANQKIKSARAVIGAILWAAIACGLIFFIKSARTHESESLTQTKDWFKQYVSESQYLISPLEIDILYDGWVSVSPGDKLYLYRGENRKEIGCINSKVYMREHNEMIIKLHVYPEYIREIGNESEFILVEDSLSVVSSASVLLPQEKLDELKKDFQEYLNKHLSEMKLLLSPFMKDVGNESYDLIKENIVGFFNEEATQAEIKAHIERLKVNYLDKELKPLFKDEIWPVVEEEVSKEIDPILKEMWEEFPTTEITWLYVYQKIPGTDNDHVEKRLRAFFDQEAMAILEDHEDELKQIPITVISKLKDNEKIKKSAQDMISKLISDEEISNWLKGSIIKLYERTKPELLNKFQGQWKPRLQKIVSNLSEKFEPYAINMANKILLNLEVGGNTKPISPELAEVIRKQILGKDRYFLYTKAIKNKDRQQEQKLKIKIFNGKRELR